MIYHFVVRVTLPPGVGRKSPALQKTISERRGKL